MNNFERGFTEELQKIAIAKARSPEEEAAYRKGWAQTGAAVGVPAGLLVGGLIGKGQGATIPGAVLGGLAGAGVGAGVGYGTGALGSHLQRRKAQQAQQGVPR